MDYYNEPYKKDFYGDPERTVLLSTANLTRESLGYYIRDEFSILKDLILSGGYRGERTDISGYNTDLSNPGNSFTNTNNVYNAEAYEAGLTWLWGNKSKVFAKYATVYRIPFLDEIACFNGYNAGTLFNTSLKQEKGESTEVGTEFYPLNNLKIGLTIFRMDMEDEIEWVSTAPLTGENQNVGSTRGMMAPRFPFPICGKNMPGCMVILPTIKLLMRMDPIIKRSYGSYPTRWQMQVWRFTCLII